MRVYRLSCFSYSLTGIIYYWKLAALPDELRGTFLMSGQAFCACLVVQVWYFLLSCCLLPTSR